jgi:hypothetical protein
LSYIVKPKTDLPTGTEIRNVARIQFDLGEIIATNQVDLHDPAKGTDPAKECLNTIDAEGPASTVEPLPPTSDSAMFMVTWSGGDDAGGSGIAGYDVYASDNGGPFQLWQDATTATSAVYGGKWGHTYAFYSVATDNVGHREALPGDFDASTTVVDSWQNADNCLNVNNDDFVSPIDALLVINELNRHGSRKLMPPSGNVAPPPYYDVNGDYYVSPIDVLLIINHLTRAGGEGEADDSATSGTAATTSWAMVANAESPEVAVLNATAKERAGDSRADDSRASTRFLESLDLLYARLDEAKGAKMWEPGLSRRDALSDDLTEFLESLLRDNADEEELAASTAF